jgi:hypothetical protein
MASRLTRQQLIALIAMAKGEPLVDYQKQRIAEARPVLEAMLADLMAEDLASMGRPGRSKSRDR